MSDLPPHLRTPEDDLSAARSELVTAARAFEKTVNRIQNKVGWVTVDAFLDPRMMIREPTPWRIRVGLHPLPPRGET